MSTFLTVMGAMLILLGLWDMFRSLLYPRGRGALSHGVMKGAWALSRSSGHRFGAAAGPASMVVVTITWVVLQVVGWALIYLQAFPPLSRRRSLAMDIDGLRAAGYREASLKLDTQTVNRDLTTLSSEVSKSVVDLVQHSESYFFQEVDSRTSLAFQLPYLVDVCKVAQASMDVDVRVAAARLDSALDALAEELAQQFLPMDGSRDEIFHAYATDHGFGDGDASDH